MADILLETPSFNLAVYSAGNEISDTVIFFLPWYLDGGNYEHFAAHREHFAELWYLAVSFDPPSTFNSPGDIRLYTISHYLKAIEELIEYFGNKDTIVVWHSLWWAVGILAAMRFPEIKWLVSIMWPYAFEEYGKKFSDSERATTWKRYSKRDGAWYYTNLEYTVPYSFVKDASQYETVSFLKESTMPKLFIWWSQDTSVPAWIVEQWAALSAEPKKYVLVDAEHNYRLHPTQIAEVQACIDAFIQESFTLKG